MEQQSDLQEKSSNNDQTTTTTMKEGSHEKTPSSSQPSVTFQGYNPPGQSPTNKRPFKDGSSALSPDGLGQSESLSNVSASGQDQDQRPRGTRNGKESDGDDRSQSRSASDVGDATSGSGLLASQSKNGEKNKSSGENVEKNKEPEKPKKDRSRQFSEPSNAFKQRSGDFDSQKSLNKDLRRVRQDSVCSTGFGSSHFGSSSSKRKGSISSSAHRVNIVTDAVSMDPTLSVEHIPKLTELYPRNYDMTNTEGLELKDLGPNGDANTSVDAENSGDLWAAKLPNINEQSEPLSKNGAPVGAGKLLPLDDDMENMTPEELEAYKKKEARKYFKNLLVLCLGFFFVFTAFLSLRNLQSSLNAKGGLGLYALSATYACFFIGCICATTIVQRLGPKRAIVVSTIGPFLYVLANFYPLFYTLIPAAAAAGFCQGVIWTAHATYIANIAASYTVLTNEKIQDVLSRFNGIFFVFYQSCQIIGGLISSIVLKSPEEPLYGMFLNGTMNGTMWNETMFGNETLPYLPYMNMTLVRDYSHCGKAYCPYTSGLKAAAPVDRVLVYILVGIFTGCSVAGILVLSLWLDKLEGSMKKTQASVGKQLAAVFKFYCNRHAICMVGLMFYSLLQAAFMFGEYTKAFVTCTLGIHMVGFVMMTLSTSSAIAAFVNGRIQQWTTRPPLVATGFIFQLAVFIVLLIWKPTPEDKAVFFILVIFWGAGDGIIMTQDISIIGFLFSHNKEPAFAALKMTQSIANFTFFMVAPYLCTIQKIAFVMTVLIVAATGYTSLEILLHCEHKHDRKELRESMRKEDRQAAIKT